MCMGSLKCTPTCIQLHVPLIIIVAFSPCTLQLKKELDAFDPSFFEEIEDLKFNYQECVRRNVQLEEQLTQQYGVTIETAESV